MRAKRWGPKVEHAAKCDHLKKFKRLELGMLDANLSKICQWNRIFHMLVKKDQLISSEICFIIQF